VGNHIKIIDLFAGPGGLAEGFSAFSPKKSGSRFEIALSVEMEYSAWRTLRLRAFTRQFGGQLPAEYYDYIAGKMGRSPEDELFCIYPEEARRANNEAMQFTLGKDSNRRLFKLIKDKIKNEAHWILIGGPPCQAYSLVGRARNKGIKDYRAEDDHRHFLYKEYLKILKKFRPSIFVMENVKGILSAKVNGELIFHKIIADIEKSGYRVYPLVKPQQSDAKSDPHDFIIRSENYGIPQARHRVILIGVRDDIKRKPGTLQRSTSTTVEQAIGDLPKLRSGLSKHGADDSSEKWSDIVCREICRFLEQINDHRIIKEMRSSLKGIAGNALGRGSNWLVATEDLYASMPDKIASWYRDENLAGVVNHDTRGHMDSDLARYLFCSCFAKVHANRNERSSPTLNDFPESLLPNHKNAHSGKFVDRFKVQEREHPASTITSHISKDGHYFIHYDPSQCRSLTVREAARIQTFPDNYFFEGNRTQQYVQIGNAVPPFLAKQIAEVVYGILKTRK